MISALIGTPALLTRNPIIFMVNGVGYRVQIPETLLTKLITTETYTLYIHTHVRDDALDLYGFLTLDELDVFDMLLSVNGVGPKIAISIMTQSVELIKAAIATADVNFFTSVPRLGKKNAQKIIIELKNKIGSLQDLDLTDSASGESDHVQEALMSMGFEKKEIRIVLKKIKPDQSLEKKIIEALQLLGR